MSIFSLPRRHLPISTSPQSFSRTKIAFTGVLLSLGLSIAGCNNMVSVPAPDTQPIHTSPTHASKPGVDSKDSANTPTQCGPFNADDPMMCTMQYDPVCVTEKTATGTRQRTAGNACSACNTPQAISYVPGQCR